MASGLAARNGGWIGLGALVAILLLGLGLRVGEAWDGRAPVYDAQAYSSIARNLDEGHGFTVGARATQPSDNYSPGLPLFVAGVYEATGGVHEQLARLVLAVVGTLSVLFAYLIARRLGRALRRPESSEVAGVPADERSLTEPAHSRNKSASIWPALVGALAVAIYPALLEYQGMLMSEPLAATILSGGVLAALWAWDGSSFRWLLPGALFGALAMTRPEYLGVAALVALVVFAREAQTDWRRSLLRTAVFFGALVVIIAPWTIRNAVALHRFVPLSTGSGQVLFAGTYLPSDGDPEAVGEHVVAENPRLFAPDAAQHLRLEQILARLAEHRYPEMESDKALSKMGKEQLWDDISDEPGEFAGFVATKIGRIWFRPARDIMRGVPWIVLQWALVVFGLGGLALLAWQRRWEVLLFAAIFLAITAISAVLVASPRRVLVFVPLLAALASVAITSMIGRARSASDFRHSRVGPKSGGLADRVPG